MNEQEPRVEELTPVEILEKVKDYLDEDELELLREQINHPDEPMDAEEALITVYLNLLPKVDDPDALLLQLGIFKEE